MGDSGTSYLVGFGKGYSQYAQVMGASCPGFPFQGRAQVSFTAFLFCLFFLIFYLPVSDSSQIQFMRSVGLRRSLADQSAVLADLRGGVAVDLITA